MNWAEKILSRLFKKTETINVSISSKNPGLSQPHVTTLTLDNEWAENEFNEGCIDGARDFREGKEMCQTLNFPAHPYARGYFETYQGLRNQKT